MRRFILQVHSRRILAASIAASLTLAGSAVADRLTVDQSGGGDFTTIQAAVDAARDGDIIFVRPGRYTGTGASVVDLGSKSVDIVAEEYECDSESSTSVVIDGEDRRRGLGYESVERGRYFGIEGLTFVNCATDADGGAMSLSGARCQVACCRFIDNRGVNGGAVYISGGEVEVVESIFMQNRAGLAGGAISHAFGPESVGLQITDSMFHANQAEHGGAVASVNRSGYLAVMSTSFWGNQASRGGAVAIYGGGHRDRASLYYCGFTANEAEYGGSIEMLHGGDLVVANSSFEDNLAERAGILNVEGSYCRVILDGVRMSRHAAARGSEVEVRGAGGWVVVAIAGSRLSGDGWAGISPIEITNAWGVIRDSSFELASGERDLAAAALLDSSMALDRNAYCGPGRLAQSFGTSYMLERGTRTSLECWDGFPSPRGTSELTVVASSLEARVLGLDDSPLAVDDLHRLGYGDATRFASAGFSGSVFDRWLGDIGGYSGGVEGWSSESSIGETHLSFDCAAEGRLEAWKLATGKDVGVAVDLSLAKEVVFSTDGPVRVTLTEFSLGVVEISRLWQDQRLWSRLTSDGEVQVASPRIIDGRLQLQWEIEAGSHRLLVEKSYEAVIEAADPVPGDAGDSVVYRPTSRSTVVLKFEAR